MADPSLLQSTTAASGTSGTPASKDPNAGAPRIRRRNRVIASCLECRRRKLKCDKLQPCTNCTKFSRECRYLASALDSAAQQRLAEIKERMGTLEQVLERDVARNTTKDRSRRASAATDSEDDDEDSGREDERDLEPSHLTVFDQVYEDDADDDLMDLGVQLGKMRVSERIGGFVRPRMADELESDILWSKDRTKPPQSLTEGAPIAVAQDPTAQAWFLTESQNVFLGPGPDYIAPSSSTMLGTDTKLPLLSYLPPRPTCDKLFDRYWTSCHPIVTVVHKPSFRQQYIFFWQNYMAGTEPPFSTQAVIAASLFMAAVTLPNTNAPWDEQGWTRATLLERLQPAIETALARANFLRTTKLETMQAVVMYLASMCRSEVSRSHSALTGAAIRLAECMGLHRDGTNYGFSALETHIRRLVWYQLCYLDIRTCEAVGPRPQIHREDFDTQLPLNVNEDDFLLPLPPINDLPYFTDMTLSRIRFETVEMHRMVWTEQRRLEAKKTTPSVVLHRITKFRKDIESRILPLLTGSDPRQLLALHLYRIFSSRLYTMVLHRFIVGVTTNPPPRLQKILIDSCLTTNEFTISLETRAELAPWAWYRGAVSQFHSCLILLFAALNNPASEDSPRIWRVLDYVYELPPDMPSSRKADSLIYALRDRLQVWSSIRKVRVPKRTEEAFAALKQMNAGKVHTEMYDAWQANMNMQGGAAQMDPSLFGMPPLNSIYSMSESGSASNPNTGYGSPEVMGQNEIPPRTEPVMDSKMAGADDFWAGWDKVPLPDATDLGMANLPDMNLGSWTGFVRDGYDPFGAP